MPQNWHGAGEERDAGAEAAQESVRQVPDFAHDHWECFTETICPHKCANLHVA